MQTSDAQTVKYADYVAEPELGCEDCLLREQHGQPRYLRIRHVDRGRIMPSGRKLDERCETCGGSEIVPRPRSW